MPACSRRGLRLLALDARRATPLCDFTATVRDLFAPPVSGTPGRSPDASSGQRSYDTSAVVSPSQSRFGGTCSPPTSTEGHRLFAPKDPPIGRRRAQLAAAQRRLRGLRTSLQAPRGYQPGWRRLRSARRSMRWTSNRTLRRSAAFCRGGAQKQRHIHAAARRRIRCLPPGTEAGRCRPGRDLDLIHNTVSSHPSSKYRGGSWRRNTRSHLLVDLRFGLTTCDFNLDGFEDVSRDNDHTGLGVPKLLVNVHGTLIPSALQRGTVAKPDSCLAHRPARLRRPMARMATS